jgi:hypothetical protein
MGVIGILLPGRNTKGNPEAQARMMVSVMVMVVLAMVVLAMVVLAVPVASIHACRYT